MDIAYNRDSVQSSKFPSYHTVCADYSALLCELCLSGVDRTSFQSESVASERSLALSHRLEANPITITLFGPSLLRRGCLSCTYTRALQRQRNALHMPSELSAGIQNQAELPPQFRVDRIDSSNASPSDARTPTSQHFQAQAPGTAQTPELLQRSQPPERGSFVNASV